MFKRGDYILIFIICFLLGIVIISQFYAGKKYRSLTQPENNQVLALEVAKLTKSNADLRLEINNLTESYNTYKNSSESRRKLYNKYLLDSERYGLINGELPKTGQGIIIKINGRLITPQIVDLVNAVKNIGGEIITVNDIRIVLNTNLSEFAYLDNYEIKVLGNSALLKSAVERRGGIIEQLSSKDLSFSVEESDNITVLSGNNLNFKYSKVIND